VAVFIKEVERKGSQRIVDGSMGTADPEIGYYCRQEEEEQTVPFLKAKDRGEPSEDSSLERAFLFSCGV
jgi:hypothetical protein